MATFWRSRPKTEGNERAGEGPLFASSSFSSFRGIDFFARSPIFNRPRLETFGTLRSLRVEWGIDWRWPEGGGGRTVCGEGKMLAKCSSSQKLCPLKRSSPGEKSLSERMEKRCESSLSFHASFPLRCGGGGGGVRGPVHNRCSAVRRQEGIPHKHSSDYVPPYRP